MAGPYDDIFHVFNAIRAATGKVLRSIEVLPDGGYRVVLVGGYVQIYQPGEKIRPLTIDEKIRAIAGVIEVTSETFEEEVLESEKPVVVHIWVSDNQACLDLELILPNLASEIKWVKFVRINSTQARDIAKRFNLKTGPAICFFSQGLMRNRFFFSRKELIIRQEIEMLWGKGPRK